MIHSVLVTVSFLDVVSEDLIPMPSRMTSQHVYEVRPRKDKRGVDLISDVLPFGRTVVRGAKRGEQCNRIC